MPPKPSRAKVAIIAVLLFVVCSALILIPNFVYTIQFGSVGILTRFGQIVGEPQNPGLHFKIPFIDNVLEYRTQKIVYQTLYTTDSAAAAGSTNYVAPSSDQTTPSQTDAAFNEDNTAQATYADYKDVAIDTTTKDGQQVIITYSVRFSLDPNKIKEIANTLGTESEAVDKIVKTDSRVWARNIPRNYSALDLYTGNVDNVSKEIKDILSPIFDQNGLILDEFYIRSIHFQSEYIQTIEQKQIEKEKISTEDYIAQQEEFRKQALITKAQGEAEAQRLQQQTLTKELIEKQYIEKWNGVLPTTVTGSDNGVILDLNK